jgi:hypothetical protein
VQNKMEERQSRQRSTNGIEQCLSQMRRAEKGCGNECEMEYRSGGGN